MNYENCPVARYCEFEAVLRNDEVIKERCVACGRVEIYRLINGEVGNIEKYTRDHIRYTCQPHGATHRVFMEIYGSAPLEQLEAHIKQKQAAERKKKDIQEVVKDAKKWIRSTNFTV